MRLPLRAHHYAVRIHTFESDRLAHTGHFSGRGRNSGWMALVTTRSSPPVCQVVRSSTGVKQNSNPSQIQKVRVGCVTSEPRGTWMGFGMPTEDRLSSGLLPRTRPRIIGPPVSSFACHPVYAAHFQTSSIKESASNNSHDGDRFGGMPFTNPSCATRAIQVHPLFPVNVHAA